MATGTNGFLSNFDVMQDSDEPREQICITWDGQAPYQMLILIGEWLEAQGFNEAAIDYYVSAASLNRANGNAYYKQGTLLSKLGRYGEAAKAFESSILADPDHNVAHFKAAVAHADNLDDEQALQRALSTIKLTPLHPGAATLAASILLATSQYNEIIIITDVFTNEQMTLELALFRAISLAELSRHSEARQLYETISQKSLSRYPQLANLLSEALQTDF